MEPTKVTLCPDNQTIIRAFGVPESEDSLIIFFKDDRFALLTTSELSSMIYTLSAQEHGRAMLANAIRASEQVRAAEAAGNN